MMTLDNENLNESVNFAFAVKWVNLIRSSNR